MTAANYQAATTGAGQLLSQTERFNSERTDRGPSVNPSAGTAIPATLLQKVVREEEQSANNPRITANSATFSRCTKHRIDDVLTG
jgi:hypothetical protein